MAFFYVTVAGAGDNSGDSWANAMTISEFESLLENTINAGDVVWVAGGTYTCSSIIDTSRNGTTTGSISIVGVNASTTNEPPIFSDWASGTDRPLFNCSAGVHIDFGYYYITVGLRITGTYNGSLWTSGAYSLVYNCAVINVYNNSGANSIYGLSSARIINCEVEATYGYGMVIGDYAYVYGCYAHDSVIGIKCGKYSTVSMSITDTCSTAGFYIDSYSDNTDLTNNTIYNCGSGIKFDNGAVACTVINNTISDCTNGFISDSSGTVYTNIWFDYNNWYNNTYDMSWDNGSSEDNSAKGYNALAVNPNFTDASNGNFSLSSSSDLIGAGLAITLGVS